MVHSWRRGFTLIELLVVIAVAAAPGADQPASSEALWKKLEPFATPPAEFAGKLGSYRSPLKFADGSFVKSAADWPRRRDEILKTWHKRLGPWPPLVERPVLKKLAKVERDGYTEYKVQVQASPEGKWVDGYLLVPKGTGPFPAVVVPFYEPLTSIGQGAKGRGVGTHDYGLQLVKRGFVTLSVGTPGSLDKLGGDTREALTQAGTDLRRQPLTLLAYVAANCLTALAQMPEVDAARIGIIGLSYGGKWSMFASCLDARFACAVWSDPGIVFNEKDSNVNYWEPWYLGFDPIIKRTPGVPSATNPRTGLYKELIDAGEDLVDLHALMAPRPVLVSGGVQDPPKNWQALNHLVAVNTMLGHKNRAFLTARKTHVPTAEALELELAFLEYFLKHAPLDKAAVNKAGEAQEVKQDIKLRINSPDEPVVKKMSLAKTAEFLDHQSRAWTQVKKCGTCHTNYPYLMARGQLGGDLTALQEVRGFFEKRVANWDSGKKEDRPKRDTEVIATAATLALQDGLTTGKLHPLTRKALDRMWTLQQANGAWDWLKCGWPPLEHDDFYGVVYVTVAVGHAPDNYADTEQARKGLEGFRKFFKNNPPPSLHHKAMLLWASQKVPGIMSDKLKESTIQELRTVQKADGGWSLPMLGDWVGFDERPNDRSAPSDGYATGLVIYVLRQAGVPAKDEALQNGVGWLKSNQRESGGWFTKSINTDRYHFLSHAGTAYAVLALKACE